MFQFTRDFIINSAKGHLRGNNRFIWDKTNECLMIEEVANLYKKFVKQITKHPYHAEENAWAKFTLDAVKTAVEWENGDVLRLVISLGQEGREISTFNNQYPQHVRRYFYEGQVCVTPGENEGDAPVVNLVPAWKAIAKGIKRDQALSDLRYWVVEDENGVDAMTDLENGDFLNIRATDCYTRIFNVRLVRCHKKGDRMMMGESLTGYKDYDVIFNIGKADYKGFEPENARSFEDAADDGIFIAAPTDYIIGCEGNGTVARLIKNMRVPTFEHMDWFGTMRDELPMPNGEYDQYMIQYVTPRRQIGHQVMGSYNDESLVTFVFFVEKGVSALFETALTNLGWKGTAEEPEGIYAEYDTDERKYLGDPEYITDATEDDHKHELTPKEFDPENPELAEMEKHGEAIRPEIGAAPEAQSTSEDEESKS